MDDPLDAGERRARAPAGDNRRSSHPFRRWLWLAVTVSVAIGAYYRWPRVATTSLANAPSRAAGRKAAGTTPVTAARVRRGVIGVYFTALGTVTPIYTVTVKSRVDGQLMKVLYREGDLVREGDLLLEIDPRPYQVQLDQAQGQLMKDQAVLENARVDLARYETLLKQNAIQEQLYATQKAAVTQAEGVVKTDQAQIDNAKLNLVYCHITAPITGRIGLRLVDPGNIVHAADSTGLLVIAQIQPISVIFPIAEDQLPEVLRRLGAGQHLRVDAYDREGQAKLATGTLATVDNQIDQTTGTVRLRANFDNRQNELFPNQFVNVRLLVEEKRGVTLIPAAAIQRTSQSTYVYLVESGCVTVRPVQVGTLEGDDAEIVSGLSPGDIVVMSGVDRLQEGSPVSVQMIGENPHRGG